MKYFRAAIRMILFSGTTVCIYSVWSVGNFFISNKIAWRQNIFGCWARSFVRISGMKLKIEGGAPRAPFLLVANHLGYIDVAALRAVTDTVFVAKKDVRHWFAAGKIISDMGTIFIDRNNRRDIPRAGSEILQRINDEESVIVFPEGTSTKGETVFPFNSSILDFAARNKLPVHYATLTYTTRTSEVPASEAVCWWDDTLFFVHLWKLFLLKDFDALIVFGKSPVVESDRKRLAQTLQKRVADVFIPAR